VKTSQSSFEQRSGRAGRLGPGICFHLCSKKEFKSRPKAPKPEALLLNPLPMVLETVVWGAAGTRGPTVPLLDCPKEDTWLQGITTLEKMGVLSIKGETVSLLNDGPGYAMASLPVEPRLGHMILECVLNDFVYDLEGPFVALQ
jgi:HrpA-like RNA helicase